MSDGSIQSQWIGLDIGGANIKAASTIGRTCYQRFELWKRHHELPGVLYQMFQDLGGGSIAVTMTGELADCFSNRRHGVRSICRAVQSAATLNSSRVSFYQTSGEFVSIHDAERDWLRTAASNWHALASLLGTRVNRCLLIDLGSTTTDIVPIVGGLPCTTGVDDTSRLKNGELIYTGIRRSPVCSLIAEAAIDSIIAPVAQEVFATTLDAYLILQIIDENVGDLGTSDGRPATIRHALQRMAKMVCADADDLRLEDIISMSAKVAKTQAALIEAGIKQVVGRTPDCWDEVVVCGEGKQLARRIVQSLISCNDSFPAVPIVEYSALIPWTSGGPDMEKFEFDRSSNQCWKLGEIDAMAPAVAVALLAERRLQGLNV
jgi:probable H4MPT-linked C1 transfer pathway protein